MSDSPENGGPKKPRRTPRSRYADKPYEIGKGKPPKEHQFKPGNGGGGRKRGSRNKSDFDKMLDEWVKVGEDRLGRPRRKRWREVINLQLLKQAAEGDLMAIRLVKEFELKQMALALKLGSPPLTAEEVARMQAEDQEKRVVAERLAGKMANTLELLAALKRESLVEVTDGHAVIAGWALDAANSRRVSASAPAPDKET